MRDEAIKIKPSVQMKHKGKEGIIKDGSKIIYNDEWLHPEELDQEYEEKMSRQVNARYRTQTLKDGEETSKSMEIDLEKGMESPKTGRTVDKSKLVRRPVMVRGKNGKTFTRMQWVDPKTGQPVSESHGHEEDQEGNEKHSEMPNLNPGKNQKEYIDHHVKNTMSKRQKDDYLRDHDIQWDKHENPQKDRINAIMAMKEHMYKNPHLVGAEHLPKVDQDVATGKDTVNAFTDRYKNHRDVLYRIMKDVGINDGIDPNNVPELVQNKTAPIKHMSYMMKLKAHLQKNPQLMNDPKYAVPNNNENNHSTPTATAPASKKGSEKPSKAEQGGNTVDGILKGMSSQELYQFMKQHGISEDGIDPRTVPEFMGKDQGGNGTGPIKHMANMMKLKKLITMNPHILNIGENGGLSDTEKQRIESMSEQQKHEQRVQNFVDQMSKELKEGMLYKYRKEPTLVNRERNDHPGIDHMRAITALKKLYLEKPELMKEDQKEVDRDHLLNMKIGNKMMAKVLRGVAGLKGVGDVNIVEDGVEWGFKTGFARREVDDSDNPILIVTEDHEDKDGNQIYREKVYEMSKVKEYIDSLKGGDEEGAAKVSEGIKATEVPLHKKSMNEIVSALKENFHANYTPEVGNVLKPLVKKLWESGGETNQVGMLSDQMRKMVGATANKTLDREQFAELLGKYGVGISPDGSRFDINSDHWKQLAYGDKITKTKNKDANDYIITHPNGRQDMWALHQSAKQWTPEERGQARRDLIHSRISVQGQHLNDLSKRHDKLADHIHKSLEYVPFDLFTNILGNGVKFNFNYSKTKKGTEIPHVGNHFDIQDGQIYFDHNYAYNDGVFKEHPMDHSISEAKHSSLPGATYRQHPFSDTAAHEFGHAIDYYLGNNTPLTNWDTNLGEKFAGKYKNVVRESYAKKLSKSNPKAEVGIAMQNGRATYFHQDEWTSWYEGRLYDSRHLKNPANNPSYSVVKDGNKWTPFDKEWGKSEEEKKNIQYGSEHWTENVARYANGVMAYQRWREQNPDQSSVSIDGWAKMMHDKFIAMGYHTDKDYNTGLKDTSYRNGLREHPIEGYGFLWHKAHAQNPHLMKGIKHILGRSDFLGSKTMGRAESVEQGDYARKSELLIYLD